MQALHRWNSLQGVLLSLVLRPHGVRWRAAAFQPADRAPAPPADMGRRLYAQRGKGSRGRSLLHTMVHIMDDS